MKGRLNLMGPAMAIQKELMSVPEFGEAPTGVLTAEMEAIKNAKKAISLDSKTSSAHCVLGYVELLQKKTLESLTFFKKSLEIDQNDIFALVGILTVYFAAGRYSESVPYNERLMQIDPLSFPANWCSGGLYYFDGNYSQALKSWQRLYQLYPDNPFSQYVYSLILSYNNRIDEALRIINQHAKAIPKNVFSKLSLILKYAIQGDKEKVLNEISEDFQKTVLRDYMYSHNLSGFLSLINQKEKALYWLENAIKIGFINYPLLSKKDPFLENIRGEERFKKLMERVKHEWENFEV